ncbi:MAG: radical SAM protein [Candidatus Aminicenantaceae bacterium]
MLLIIKPTEACNCNCIYCSAFYGENPHRSRMNIGTFELIIKKALEWVSEQNQKNINILWHGGEPLLMGVGFYQNVLKICEHYKKVFGVEIRHIMQSNLHFMDDSLSPVISSLLFNGGMSSSFDVVKGIRTIKSDSDEYNNKFLKGLKKAGEYNIRVNSVYVVHNHSLDHIEHIINYLMDYPLYSMRLNPLAKLGRALEDPLDDLYITSLNWGKFLLEFYNKLRKRKNRKPVEPFEEYGLMDNKDNRSRGQSCASGFCMEQILAFDSEGKAYGCGKFSDMQRYELGDIRKHDFKDFLENSIRQKILNRKPFLRNTECCDCPFWELCRGGCPMDNFNGDILPYTKTMWCEGIQYFLKNVLTS